MAYQLLNVFHVVSTGKSTYLNPCYATANSYQYILPVYQPIVHSSIATLNIHGHSYIIHR